MNNTVLVALRTAILTLVVTGLVYPLAITGIAQVVFPAQANGSLLRDEQGLVVGSELIAQAFTNPAYVWPRPSAAGNGYDASASSGSNLGVTAAKLHDRVHADVERLQTSAPAATHRRIPADLLTASGSGLDPHITPEGALWQVERVAAARHVSAERVAAVIHAHTQAREFGLLGEPRVNVLVLNRALDRRFGHPLPPHLP